MIDLSPRDVDNLSCLQVREHLSIIRVDRRALPKVVRREIKRTLKANNPAHCRALLAELVGNAFGVTVEITPDTTRCRPLTKSQLLTATAA